MLGYLFYRLAYILSVKLSLKNGYRLATWISLLKYYLSPRDREAVIHNLGVILPPSELLRINQHAKKVFINFGKYMLEFFRFKLLKKEGYGRYFQIKGLEYVNEALKRNKGVIIISAHMGNWELGGVLMGLMGYPMIAVALPHKYKKINELFNSQREYAGAIVVPSMGAAMRKIYASLKNNKIVALVGDRDFTGGGKRMDFLGASKIIPRGPAVLAKRTGAAIVPGFVIRQKDDTHLLEFFPPLDASKNEEELMIEYTKIIESKIREYPDQWLIFREFEKE